MNCVNTSSPEFKNLLDQTGMDSISLELEIKSWQDQNNTENFPSIEDLRPSQNTIFTEEADFLDKKELSLPSERQQQKDKSEKFMIEFVEKLKSNFKMSDQDVSFITRDQVDTINPEWNGQAGFVKNGKVFFVKDQLNYNVAFHEFAHIGVRAVREDNLDLFNKLFQDVTSTIDGKTLHREAASAYSALDSQHEIIKEETIVKALTKIAADNRDLNPEHRTNLNMVLSKILFAIKKAFRKVFGKSKKVENLDLNTSLKELSDMVIDESWDIDMTVLTEDDYVRYYNENNKFYNEVVEEFNNPEGRVFIFRQATNISQMAQRQLKVIKSNQDLEILKNTMETEYGETAADEILGRLRNAGLSQNLKNEAIDELQQFDIRARAMALNISTISESISKMTNTISELKDNTNEQESIQNAIAFQKLLDHYESYVNDFLRDIEDLDIVDLNNELYKELASMQRRIQTAHTGINNFMKFHLRDALYEIWEPMYNKVVDKKTKAIERYKKQLAKSTNNRSKKFLTTRIATLEEFVENFPDREAMLDSIVGRLGDIGALQAFMINANAMQDPSIASFSLLIKKHLSRAHSKAHKAKNEFLDDLEPYYDKLGVDPKNIDKFSDLFLFEEDSFRYEEGEMVQSKVYTLLNPLKDHKYKRHALRKSMEDAYIEYEKHKNDETYKDYIDKMGKLEKHDILFMNKPYVDEFYFADEELLSTQLGRDAFAEAQKALGDLQTAQNQNDSAEDAIEDKGLVDMLLSDYRQLFSLYDKRGNKKTGIELEKAELLRKNRETKNKFYDRNLKKENILEKQFLNDYRAEQLRVHAQLIHENYEEDSTEYNKEYQARLDKWKDDNSRVVYDPSYWDTLNNIYAKINSILGENKLDPKKEYVLESMKSSKDSDGQPIGVEMTEEHLKRIKDYEEQLYNEKQLKDKLTKEQYNTLRPYFNKLQQIKTTKATTYYIEFINNKFQELIGEEITQDNVSDLLNVTNAEELFSKSDEFKKWFKDNHYLKEVYNEKGEKRIEYVRTSAWNINVPTDEKHYQKYTFTDPQTNEKVTLNGMPSFKYYKREVKKEFHTGYNPETKQVELEEGVHIDQFTGHWLPKNLSQMTEMRDKYLDKFEDLGMAWDQYVNYQYENMDKNSDQFKALELIKKHFAKSQEGLDNKVKMGWELPRFRRDMHEYLSGKTLKDGANAVSRAITAVKDSFFRKAEDDAGDIFNYQETTEMIIMDSFGEQSSKIPIRGKYNLGIDDVSKDVTSSILRYMLSAEENKELAEMHPMARTMKSLAENTPVDIKKTMKNRNNTITEQRIKGGDNNRKKVIDSLFEVHFEGKNLFENSANNVQFNKVLSAFMGLSTHSFFAFDVVSAGKNFFGAQMQIALEAAGHKYYSYAGWQRGRIWAADAMRKLSMFDLYEKSGKGVDTQIIEIFDAFQGRMTENDGKKFAEAPSRSMKKDTANMGWTHSFRQYFEIETNLQVFAAIMTDTKIDVTNSDGSVKQINYLQAWELDQNGSIKLKDGIDKKYDIEGSEFDRVKNTAHEVNNFLQGNYASFDQSMMSRFAAWKIVLSMKKYFTKMFMHRFAYAGRLRNPKERFNLPTQDTHMGWWVEAIKTHLHIAKYFGANLPYLSSSEKRAMGMFYLDLAKLAIVKFLVMGILLGYDPDDEDRISKLKERGGALPTPFTADEDAEKFNAWGWSQNLLLLTAMDTYSEMETFNLIPGYGGLTSTTDAVLGDVSVAAGGSVKALVEIVNDLSNLGDDSGYYKDDVGALKWQKEGSAKFWKKVFRLASIKGKAIDPATAIKNREAYVRL